jgi:hypothetical protein
MAVQKRILIYAMGLLFAWAVGLCIMAARSLRAEISIDLLTGQTREQTLVFSHVVSERVADTEFSRKARRAGFEMPRDERDWRVDTVKYRYREVHEHPQFHGAISELEQIAVAWELSSTPGDVRVRQAQTALSLLHNGKHLDVDLVNESEVLVRGRP